MEIKSLLYCCIPYGRIIDLVFGVCIWALFSGLYHGLAIFSNNTHALEVLSAK